MAVKAKKPLTDVVKLTKAQAKVELMRLSLEIEAHNERYYQKDAPSVSDAAYDALRQRLETIEQRFPDLVTKDALPRGKRVATNVSELASDRRREEIARMLAGAEITDEARKAAERLIRAAG